MKLLLRCITLSLAAIFTQTVFSQCVPLPTLTVQNPSFEGPTGPGITPAPWTECMIGQTPDTQPGNWGVNMPPTNGSTYIGLVHQVSTNWQEGASEPLSGPMSAGVPYTFTVDLANSSTTGGGIVPGCAECQIWGGFGACDDNTGTGTLLWSSGDITPMDTWMNYTVSFTPAQNYTWMMIRVNSLGCNPIATDQPYILVDNISPIVPNNVSILTTTVDQSVACPGLANGQATVHAAGQYLPFNYIWNSTPVQTDSMLTNVPAGTYAVTVTDANTCTATASITITQPQPLVLTPTVNNISCFGFNTGSAYMSYSGGTLPFSFHWSNNVNTQPNGNLFAGTYGITATDGNGCTATSSITVTEPAQLSVTGTPTSPTCNTSGSITTTTTGGTTPYTYSWNTTPPQTSANASNLVGGTYTITVTDTNACTATAIFNLITPPNIPSVTLSATNVICFGQNSGSIGSNPSGGTPGYTYSWSTAPPQVTPAATNLVAGNYSLTITDAATCTASASVTITQPVALSVTTVKTDVLCFGQSTGNATATPAGGTPGYSYSWNTVPVQTNAAAVNLPAGTFTIIVTDVNSCTATANAVISQPPSALSLSETHTDVSCFGGNNGSATVIATGATAGYTYNWNTTPVQTTATASSLIAATYIVTVTDANSCTASIASVVSQPPLLTVTAGITAPTCFGQPAASATSTASGGTAGYNYSWNTVPVQNTQNVTNIPAGTYTVTATDANSCTATASITVAPPPTQLVLTTSHIDVLCFGAATGSVTVNASGSYGNYSYDWNSNPVQTTSVAGQLIAGTYNVTVTDIQGCSATASDIVFQPASALSISTVKTDILCFGASTGSATVTANGGTGGYNYVWNTTPQQTTSSITSLIAGTYDVTVTDANGCSQTGSEIINQPALLTAGFTSVNVTCNAAGDGSINVTATGGTTAYSYQWSIVPSVNSPSAGALPPGNYSVTVTDANSCSVSIGNIIITEPTALVLNPIITNVSCPGRGDGSIDANPSGGTPIYTFNWSNGINLQLNSNIAGGNYSVTVTDSHSCTASAGSTVIELPAVTLSAAISNIPCAEVHTGSIAVIASSSFLPIQYVWNNGAVTSSISALNTGTYTISVIDAHGCSADSSFYVGNDSVFSIDATPDTITINLGETVDLNVAAIGSSFGSAIWTPSNGLNCSDCFNPTSSAIGTTTYVVTGTDVNGCIANDVVHVTVVPIYNVFIPNVFTPNGDGNNDFFEVFGNKEAWKQFNLMVFDRWGEKVYDTNDMNFKWDGMYKGKMLNPAVFVYEVKIVYLNNYTDKLFKGTVTLIR